MLLQESEANAEYLSQIDLDNVRGKIVILYTNDTHGYLLEDSERSMDAATLLSLKKVFETAGAEVLLLDAGDTLNGAPMFKKNLSEPMVDLLNQIGYDAITLGNHDFDYGADKLMESTKKLNIPIICSNVVNITDNNPAFTNYKLFDKAGKKIGIFGITTTEEITGFERCGSGTLKINNPTICAKKMCTTLKKEGADFIIALGHIGMDARSELSSVDIISEATDIDLFIDAHSHSSIKLKMIHEDGSETLLVRNLHYFSEIGVVTIDKDNYMQAYTIEKKDVDQMTESLNY